MAIAKFVSRMPNAEEERLSMLAETQEQIVAFAKEMRDHIVASGVNIIGDINSLMKVPPPRPKGSVCGSKLNSINMDIAVSMVESINISVAEKDRQAAALEAVLNEIYSSRSWRWTAPLRRVVAQARIMRDRLRRLR